ncbi:MATE family efflux transporter [Fulvivirgaceae bacterium BMA12]|uniref:Multidrug export protein MepA n=1 Tax=Agaribacillus aureus TaxID=3051825 RepID=A0ABT8LHM8_9BACT|nr:MATE family efflux transporter [Fulvivirgaceae bacterium BMA12]
MDLKDRQKELILNEALTKVMWKLSLPAILAMVLFGLNAFMDTVYIGQLMDETALSGVALAYPLASIMMGFGAWAGTGAANLLSIAIGKDDMATQEKILANSTLVMLVTTGIFAIPSYFFASPLIRMMGGSGEVLAYGVDYFRITLLASPFWVYGLGLNFIIRGEGRMKTAAIMMSYGLIVNLVLTPLFIRYLEMGVAGAAWATNIGMLIYCIVGYLYFNRGKASFNSNINSLIYDKAVFQSILKMGFPGFILTIMGLVQAIVVFNAIVGAGDEKDLAFFAAANRILLFIMTPLFGLMRALQPVIGINFGAGLYYRVKDSFLLFTKTGLYIVAPFWLALMIFPEASLRLVLPQLVFSGQDLFNFQIYMLALPVLPFVFMSLTFFPAINEEKYGSIIGMARQLVFYVPVMLLLPKYFGVNWVYYGATLIDVVISIWILLVVRKLFLKLKPSPGLPESA